MDERSDRDLVVASCRGDRTAYASLVGRHYKQIFLVCFGVLGNVHDAEDVAQDTMIKGFERIRQLRNGSQFGGWAAAIARNLSVNLLRKQKTMRRLANGQSAGPGAARATGIPSASSGQALPTRTEGVPPSDRGRDARDTRGQDALDTGALEDLRGAVARLPWDLRLPLVMYYFDGQDVKAVAQKLDMSTSGVYLKLRTAIKELHDLLQGDTP